MDIDTEPFNVDTDIDYETPRIRREAEPQGSEPYSAVDELQAEVEMLRTKNVRLHLDLAADSQDRAERIEKRKTMNDLGAIEEIKQARRSLACLRFEVEPCIADDISRLVESAFNAIKDMSVHVAPVASQQSVLQEIAAERSAQDAKWGGPEHDDKHEEMEWAEFIEYKAVRAYRNGDYRNRMIQIAALAVAAVESYDRKQSNG